MHICFKSNSLGFVEKVSQLPSPAGDQICSTARYWQRSDGAGQHEVTTQHLVSE